MKGKGERFRLYSRKGHRNKAELTVLMGENLKTTRGSFDGKSDNLKDNLMERKPSVYGFESADSFCQKKLNLGFISLRIRRCVANRYRCIKSLTNITKDLRKRIQSATEHVPKSPSHVPSLGTSSLDLALD
jgi:hypothetical protein